MPEHRIPRARLDEDLRKLRRFDREEFVSVTYEGDTAIVITQPITTVETRNPADEVSEVEFPDFAAKRTTP
jgi:hypothetical protein